MTGTHIAAKVDNARDEAPPVPETSKHFFDAQSGVPSLFGICDLTLVDAEGSDFLFPFGEKLRLTDAVGKHEECNDCHQHGGETLDEEEDSP